MRKLSIFVGYLISLLLIILSGCSSTETLSEEIIEDFQITIEEDQYYVVGFEINKTKEVNVQFEVVSGPNVEGFMVDEMNYKRLINMMDNGQFDENLKHFSDFHSYGTTVSERTGSLSPGTYYYVIDHTDYFNTIPPLNFTDDVVTVNVFISAK